MLLQKSLVSSSTEIWRLTNLRRDYNIFNLFTNFNFLNFVSILYCSRVIGQSSHQLRAFVLLDDASRGCHYNTEFWFYPPQFHLTLVY